MSSLNSVLETYRSAPVHINTSFGGLEAAPAPESPGIADRKALKAELEAVKNSNRFYFQVCFAALTILFLVSLYVIYKNLNADLTFKTFLTFVEGIVAALIAKMMQLWREKNDTELLLALALYTEGNALQQVIDVLASRLKPSDSAGQRHATEQPAPSQDKLSPKTDAS